MVIFSETTLRAIFQLRILFEAQGKTVYLHRIQNIRLVVHNNILFKRNMYIYVFRQLDNKTRITAILYSSQFGWAILPYKKV